MKILFLFLFTIITIPIFGQEKIPYRSGNLWGFSDKNKVKLLKPQFQETGVFSGNRALFKQNDKYGYLNENFEKIIDNVYVEASDFAFNEKWNQDVAIVKVLEKNEVKDLYIDSLGHILGDFRAPNFLGISNSSGGVVTDMTEVYQSVMKGNKTYKVIVKDPAKVAYDEANKLLKYDLLIVNKNNKYGLVDYNGKVIIPVVNNLISSSSDRFPNERDELLIISNNGFYSISDVSGKAIIKLKCKWIDYKGTGLFIVMGSDNKEFYVNEKGTVFKDN